MADARARLVALAKALRALPEVVLSGSTMDCRASLAGPVLEWRTEAELRDGAVLTWWLEVCQDSGDWVIEASVTLDRDRAQHTLAQLPTRLTPPDGDLGQDLADMVAALLDRVPRRQVGELVQRRG